MATHYDTSPERTASLASRMFGNPENPPSSPPAAPEGAADGDSADELNGQQEPATEATRSLADRMFGGDDEPEPDDDADDADDPGGDTERTDDDDAPDDERTDDTPRRHYNLKTVEGDADMDVALASMFTDAAHEANMSQDKTQRFIDDVAPKLVEMHQRQLDGIVTGWVNETKADSEIGRGNLNDSLATARRVIERFGTPELRTLIGPIARGGLGINSNPEVIRLLNRVGKALKL